MSRYEKSRFLNRKSWLTDNLTITCFTLAIVSLAFFAAFKVFIFHLTREAAREKPMEPFSPSRTSEFNIDAATEDLLDCEPRLVPAASDVPMDDWVWSFIAASSKPCFVSVCPEVEGAGKWGAPAIETRLEREEPGSPEGGMSRNWVTEAVEDLRRLLAPNWTEWGRASGWIVSEYS